MISTKTFWEIPVYETSSTMSTVMSVVHPRVPTFHKTIGQTLQAAPALNTALIMQMMAATPAFEKPSFASNISGTIAQALSTHKCSTTLLSPAVALVLPFEMLLWMLARWVHIGLFPIRGLDIVAKRHSCLAALQRLIIVFRSWKSSRQVMGLSKGVNHRTVGLSRSCMMAFVVD
jgi:hypothetical protein